MTGRGQILRLFILGVVFKRIEARVNRTHLSLSVLAYRLHYRSREMFQVKTVQTFTFISPLKCLNPFFLLSLKQSTSISDQMHNHIVSLAAKIHNYMFLNLFDIIPKTSPISSHGKKLPLWSYTKTSPNYKFEINIKKRTANDKSNRYTQSTGTFATSRPTLPLKMTLVSRTAIVIERVEDLVSNSQCGFAFDCERRARCSSSGLHDDKS